MTIPPVPHSADPDKIQGYVDRCIAASLRIRQHEAKTRPCTEVAPDSLLLVCERIGYHDRHRVGLLTWATTLAVVD